MKHYEIFHGAYLYFEGKPYLIGPEDVIDFFTYPKEQRKYSGIIIQEEHLNACLDLTLTEKDGVPVYYNGDNIMVFYNVEKDGYVNCRMYLHSEVDGTIFYVNRIKYLHEFQMMYAAIEKNLPDFENLKVIH
jgi:hypothetical protein